MQAPGDIEVTGPDPSQGEQLTHLVALGAPQVWALDGSAGACALLLGPHQG